MGRISVFLIVLSSFLLLSARSQSQEKAGAKADSVSLLDTTKVVAYLELTKAQKAEILSRVGEIQKIVNEDKKIRDERRARFMSGEGRPALGQGQFNPEAMQAARAQMMERQNKIGKLVEEIQAKLNSKQKEKFKNVIVPDLREMARAERERWREMRQR